MRFSSALMRSFKILVPAAMHGFITSSKRRNSFLTALGLAGSAALFTAGASAAPKIDKEYLDIGVQSGFLNVEDFGSNIVFGAVANLKASEKFFLQFELFQGTIDVTEAELRFNAGGTNLAGEDRDYLFYGVGLGYNLYQAEFFTLDKQADLASFYVTAGVGETDFGDDAQFTTHFGLGYQMALYSDVLLNVDYKGYLYDTSLIGDDDEAALNTKAALAITYLF